MKALALILAISVLVCGVLFEDSHYRLHQIAQASDQQVLDHRDSSYTSMTWVGSRSENYLQLRFFDKVEGGLCLSPTWADLAKLGESDPRLAHLRGSGVGIPPNSGWTGPVPDPGTLPNSPYVRFFPVGPLLNDDLMARAKGDPRAADPHVLVIGLGSSAGLLVLAHHFPQASITCVDIDARVIGAVRDHVPLTRWLESQRTADGSPRLTLVAEDARQFVRFEGRRRSRPFDLIILDAYTAGSTIPSHLMTREFFAECAAALAPGGLVMGNIIGSYDGEKRRVLGGCLRSLRAGGLTEAYNIPVLSSWYDSPGNASLSQPRNNIVLSSRKPIDPRRAAAAWARLTAFVPFPELPLGRYRSSQYVLLDESGRQTTSMVPAEAIDALDPALRLRLREDRPEPGAPQFAHTARSDDSSVVTALRAAVRRWYAERKVEDGLGAPPTGWEEGEARGVHRREIDWVAAAREVWRVSVAAAMDAGTHGGEPLVGPVDGPDRDGAASNWRIADAPLFTDQMANADIVNH